ncbi:hypothetical protein HDV00_011553 [Rhizophlyctis rosea]|nr:hypothetical protein HDV00_011553 [Rhizophlyctis rosea]
MSRRLLHLPASVRPTPFLPLPTATRTLSSTRPMSHAKKKSDTPDTKQQLHYNSEFGFLGLTNRGSKPRSRGITEIRGPYYSIMGPRYLRDVLESACGVVDSLKFAGGSFTLMPSATVRELISIAHEYDVKVSTGGFIERVLTAGLGPHRDELVTKYLKACKDIGFDTIELSSGFITISTDDWSRLVDRVHDLGLKAKPEVGIQFGAGGTTDAESLERLGQKSTSLLIAQAKQFISQGCDLIMIESEGITESVKTWRTDVISQIVSELGIEKTMFEASEPAVFTHYVRTYGPEVNLFVDHSQVLQLEGVRRGLWGTSDVWGKVVGF